MTRPASEAYLPKGWPRFVTSALLHVIALAGLTLSHVHSGRRTSEVERLQTELGLVQQQVCLVSARLSRVPARHRPHYTPTERLEILERGSDRRAATGGVTRDGMESRSGASAVGKGLCCVLVG